MERMKSNLRFEISQANNGYILVCYGTVPITDVYTEDQFDMMISEIGYRFGELEIDEKFELKKVKE